jgi:hypothetical protein
MNLMDMDLFNSMTLIQFKNVYKKLVKIKLIKQYNLDHNQHKI